MMKEVSSITDLSSGVVNEQFKREWEKIMQNIADPSTDAKKKRKFTLEVEIIPNDDRSFAALSIKSKSSLAPVKSDDSAIFMELSNNGVIAMSPEKEEQQELPNVYELNKEVK